jgi:hypothetical protein
VAPRQTLTLLRQRDPELLIIPKDIHNYINSLRRDQRQGHSSTEALLLHLESKNRYYQVLLDDETNRLIGIFIACPESIQHLQSHHDVLIIDNTYSTNRFNLPLMDIIG